MRAGWGQWVHQSIRDLSQQYNGGQPRVVTGKGGGGRFKFGGIYKDNADTWRVKIGPGVIVYREIFLYRDFDSEGSRRSRAQYCTPVFPTVEYNGDDVRIDDESKPALELGDRDSASVWLVARKDKCNSSSIADGRIIISDRDEDPDIESSEDAIKIVDFDVEETDGGGKRATEVYKFLQSDHHQGYVCDKGTDSSDDYDGSDMDSSSDFVPESSSDMGGSTPSGSSDGDSDDNDGPCQVRVVAGWSSPVTCFPKAPGAGPTDQTPAPFDFTIRVSFIFQQPFGGVTCEAIAYGAELVGGYIQGTSPVKTEYVWRDEKARELTWRMDRPPACGTLQVKWRWKTFDPKRGPLDPPSDDVGCCNFSDAGTTTVILRDALTTGPWNSKKTKLPHVCGHTCSSSATGSDSGSEEEPPP